MPDQKPDSVTIAELATAMAANELSSQELTEAYINRIQSLDETYHAVLTLNPDAQDSAQTLDEERARQGPRGLLHGIPILVKDNLDTGDTMATTAGSLALAGTRADSDATVVARLRAAGCVILGKTNLSEWANFRSTRSSSGWSSLGGQTRNAYAPERTPGGSSSGSGVATALGFCAAAIGTETDGSIVGPAAMNGIVGIKPSIGLVSRQGIIPIAASQDTAGPMARTVSDAAILLAAISGPDPRDPVTRDTGRYSISPSRSLDGAALRGARIGVARDYTGYHDRVDGLFDAAIDVLARAGAVIIDPVCLTPAEFIQPEERLCMEYEFKQGLNDYLSTRSAETAIRTLDDIIAFNLANAEKTLPYFRQEILESAARRGPLSDEFYQRARKNAFRLAATEGIDAAVREHSLSALIAPTTTPAWLIDWISGDNRRGSCACPPAVAGYPHITVPMGYVEHLPVGLSFFAARYQDQTLIDLASGFEQLTAHRRVPEVQPLKSSVNRQHQQR